MTYTAVGAYQFAANNGALTSFSFVAGGVGDFVLCEVISNGTRTATGLSSSNATWVPLGNSAITSNNSAHCQCFLGTVTSATTQTVTITWGAGTAGGFEGTQFQEFSTTTGIPVLDKQTTLDSAGTNTWPTLAPATTLGEIYFGYALNATSAVAGSTSGYVYNASDGLGNGSCYNLNVTTSTAPVWGDAGESAGIMVLVGPPSPASSFVGATVPPGRQSPMAFPYRYYPVQVASAPPAAATPSPFYQPGTSRGRTAATKARLQSSPGSPVVPRIPATFVQPGRTTRGRPAASKARSASSPGAIAVRSAPFAPPTGTIRGRPAARQSRLSSSAGSPVVPRISAPFSPPSRTVRGQPVARRSRTASSPGSPVVVSAPPTPAPFYLPERTTRGLPAIRKSRSSTQSIPPVVPSPFYLPERTTRGLPAARKARTSSSPGSPFVAPPVAPFVPPKGTVRGRPAAVRSRISSSPGVPVFVVVPTPAPFVQPKITSRGRPVAARTRTSSSPGSPVVLTPPITPSPFVQPQRIVRGAAAARKSRSSSSSGSTAVVPAPFRIPPGTVRGRPLAARSRLQGSKGAPVVPARPSPFQGPPRTIRGARAATRSRLRSSPGVVPSLPPPPVLTYHDLIPGLFPY